MFELYTTYSDDNYDFLSNIINNIVRRNFNELECSDNSYSLIINIDIYEFITQHNNNIENTYIGPRVLLKCMGKYKKIQHNDILLKDENKCPICFDLYKEGEFKRVLSKCNHVFHKKCIDKWLCKEYNEHNKMSCPICRETYTNTSSITNTIVRDISSGTMSDIYSNLTENNYLNNSLNNISIIDNT